MAVGASSRVKAFSSASLLFANLVPRHCHAPAPLCNAFPALLPCRAFLSTQTPVASDDNSLRPSVILNLYFFESISNDFKDSAREGLDDNWIHIPVNILSLSPSSILEENNNYHSPRFLHALTSNLTIDLHQFHHCSKRRRMG